MAPYSDAELELLMADLESDLVKRKESAADGRKIRRNICAFANDLPGNGRAGVVLVGIRDDGSCASVTINDELLTLSISVRTEVAGARHCRVPGIRHRQVDEAYAIDRQ